MKEQPTRRSVLRLGALSTLGIVSGCQTQSSQSPQPTQSSQSSQSTPEYSPGTMVIQNNSSLSHIVRFSIWFYAGKEKVTVDKDGAVSIDPSSEKMYSNVMRKAGTYQIKGELQSSQSKSATDATSTSVSYHPDEQAEIDEIVRLTIKPTGVLVSRLVSL